jgi:hypothetical protein
MKTKYLLLAAGLAIAGTALAGDPIPQAAASAPSVKVGIDKTTGKLRPLTDAESAALDAQAAQQGSDNNSLRAGTRTQLPSRAQRLFRLPTTQKEALATETTYNGYSVIKPPAESLSEMTVQKNADGSLTILENGDVMSAKAQKTPEAGNE